MSLDLALALPVAIACAAGAGFAVNEWSHGALAEAAGLGHHHALDAGGLHCTGGGRAGAHLAHMHANATGHDGCPGPLHGAPP